MKPLQSVRCFLLIVTCVCLSACAQKTPAQDSTTLATTTTTVTTTTAQTTTTTATSVNVAQSPSTALDPEYSRLLLVNATHTITADFNQNGGFASLDKTYINGSLSQVDKGMHPYLVAMIDAARKDGVWMSVCSPYRSYAIQSMLFNNKVNSVIKAGTPADQAEAVAARSVARPGTSEHQTGLAVDINTASSAFESQPAYAWLKEHAQEYGFILRYPENKTDITGIKYEPWHWRFVGINAAKEMNRLGVTLEEYVE